MGLISLNLSANLNVMKIKMNENDILLVTSSTLVETIKQAVKIKKREIASQ
jgi:hypothetical protein